MADHHTVTRLARSAAAIEGAVLDMMPAPERRPYGALRRLDAQRALLAAAGRALMTTLGWRSCRLRAGKPRAARADAASVEVIFSPDTMYSIEAVGAIDRHPLADSFAGAAQAGLSAALRLVRALDAEPSTADRGYEMYALALEPWIVTSFLRKLLDPELTPLENFFLGYLPMQGAFGSVTTLIDWLRGVPAATFEGSPLETGVVFAKSVRSLTRSGNVKLARFKRPIPFEQVRTSSQTLVLADGHRAYLALGPDMKVYGVALLSVPLEERALAPDGAVARVPFPTLWAHASEHGRLALYGEHDDLIQIGHLRQGRLRLQDPRVAVSAFESALRAFVELPRHAVVPTVCRALLARARLGHGGGVVIGPGPLHTKAERLRRPFAVGEDTAWTSFLNPDGAVLMNDRLEVVSFGAILPAPSSGDKKGLPAPDRGTRHNALGAATRDAKHVAIAISDDRTLTVFQGGRAALTIE